jgi:ABC-type transport system substrate-binding protein
MVSRWKAGQLPFFLSAWRFENGDATSFLRDCLYTRDPARGYGSFNPGFSDAQLDRLIDENDQVFGEGERLKHYEKMMRLVLQQMPLVPLDHRVNFCAVADRVLWEPRLDGKLLAVEMSLRP